MRPLQDTIINSQTSSTNQTSKVIDLRQIVCLSAQALAGTGAAAGTFQLQVTNDPCLGPFQNYNPTNWTNLGSALTFAQSSTASNQMIPKTDVSHVAMRVLWDSTPGAVTTIVATADTAGSLNNTFFLFSSSTTAYYAWFNVSSGGTDPALVGRTGVEMDIATGATASTVGAAVRAALAQPGVVVTGATDTAIATGATASDGSTPTGFNFTPTSNNTSLISVQLSALGL